jgi:sulfur carrier protein
MVNGAPCPVPDGMTVADLLAARDAAGPGNAVAVDGVVVPRRLWSALELRDGQRVELVTAVQGG